MKVGMIIVSAIAALALLGGTANAQDRTEQSRALLTKRLDHSLDVVRFFENRGKWLRATRTDHCWQVPWTKSCRIARDVYQTHIVRAKHLQTRLDLTDPIVQNLNAGLSGTPMAGTGVELRNAGRAYNISPYFIAAVAGTESSYGAAACGPYNHNAWGLGNCGTAWTPPSFPSWGEAYMWYARFLSERWPSATSPYSFNGYAACDDCWARKVTEHMYRFGASSYTKYPASREI